MNTESTKSTSALLALIHNVATAAKAEGGRALVVGGAVRDEIMGQVPQEYDLEIFGVPVDRIRALLQSFGPVEEVGAAFGIYKLRLGSDVVDVAAPRKERKIGTGHRGFEATIDPTLTPEAAARRRDFTLNSMYRDPLTDEVIDPFDGQADVKQRRLRVVDPATFGEDPLRVLRAVQLAARLELTIDPGTLEVLRSMLDTIRELPKDRIREEWTKLFLLAKHPSIGLEAARQIGLFKASPEIMKLESTEQDPTSHPEGTAWNHTLLAVDQAAQLAPLYHSKTSDRLAVMLGIWLHDVGKGTTAALEDGRIKHHGHDLAGVGPAKRWLSDQGFSHSVRDIVASLVSEHMHLYQLEHLWPKPGITDGAIRRLVNRLWPAKIELLLTLRQADSCGRGADHANEPYPLREWILKRLAQLKLSAGPSSIIHGRDLIELGWEPSPAFHQVIEAAERAAERNLDREDVLQAVRRSGGPEDAIINLNALH